MRIDVLEDAGDTTITKTFYDDGVQADPGSVTVDVARADGTALVTGAAAGKSGSGTSATFSYTLQASWLTQVDILTVTWTRADTGGKLKDTVEIVGDLLFTITELRAFHDDDLADTTVWSNDDIAAARLRIVDSFEQICGVSFVPRYRRRQHAGDGTSKLIVERPKITTVLSAVDSTVDVTADATPDPLLPVIYHTDGTWTAPTPSDPLPITVAYRHGWETAPEEIRRAALILARRQLIKDVTGAGVPDQASSWNDGTGQFVAFAANDRTGRWFGIPPVDVALRRYTLRAPIG